MISLPRCWEFHFFFPSSSVFLRFFHIFFLSTYELPSPWLMQRKFEILLFFCIKTDSLNDESIFFSSSPEGWKFVVIIFSFILFYFSSTFASIIICFIFNSPPKSMRLSNHNFLKTFVYWAHCVCDEENYFLFKRRKEGKRNGCGRLQYLFWFQNEKLIFNLNLFGYASDFEASNVKNKIHMHWAWDTAFKLNWK